MASKTVHYGLEQLVKGDSLADDSYQFTDADRALIDRLLWLGAEAHHHNGGAAVSEAAPTSAPTLTLDTTQGVLPAGSRIYYKYAYVDANGFETLCSPEAYVDTPAPVSTPAAAALNYSASGGTLLPGTYTYAITAYKGANTQETTESAFTSIVLPSGSTNQITVLLPGLPSGADGWNIYRQGPGDFGLFYLASVASGGGPTYTDGGSVAESGTRQLPASNTTSTTNAVSVTTPTVPANTTWKLYRTLTPAVYTDSLVHWVVEETTEGSGIITPTYLDLGYGTLSGSPVSKQLSVGSPPKVILTDGGEAQGRLPIGQLAAVPQVITFSFAGQVTVATGTAAWVCEFPSAIIAGARAYLGPGYYPASQAVIADVQKGTGTTPTYSSVYSSNANRPQIPVNNQIGTIASTLSTTTLNQGDSLIVSVLQAGGGGTPHDYNLCVDVLLLPQFTQASSSGGWS